jgi:heavy metal sensor kinase
LLQVGVSLARVNESVAQLRRLFLFLIPGGLVAVGAASWLMARRSLAPIGRMAREARKLTAASLDQRVALPAGKDEVAELASTINEMLDRLERAFRAQERFIADASHELKTPLSVLLGEAQILLQQVRTPEEYDRFVASVQDEMRQMARLVDSLLILARADAGFRLEASSPVAVNEAVTDAVQRCEAAARQREVRLVPNLAPPTQAQPELAVSGDAALLRAMLENLIRNAIRHSPPEDVVEVGVSGGPQEVAITVRDRGPGVPADALERVFERFYRVPRGDPALQGAGLGLAIARGVVVLHGGTIRASNRPGGGSEFLVNLPLTPDPNTHSIKRL